MQTTYQIMSLLARTRNDAIRTQQIGSIVIGLALGLVVWWLVAKRQAKRKSKPIDYKAKEGWLAGLLVALLIIGGTFLMIHLDVNTLSEDEIPSINL